MNPIVDFNNSSRVESSPTFKFFSQKKVVCRPRLQLPLSRSCQSCRRILKAVAHRGMAIVATVVAAIAVVVGDVVVGGTAAVALARDQTRFSER